jgi:hypothetical protein
MAKTPQLVHVNLSPILISILQSSQGDNPFVRGVETIGDDPLAREILTRSSWKISRLTVDPGGLAG